MGSGHTGWVPAVQAYPSQKVITANPARPPRLNTYGHSGASLISQHVAEEFSYRSSPTTMSYKSADRNLLQTYSTASTKQH